MSSSGQKFTEPEANEILRIAVQMAAPGRIGRDELAIVAAQLGISEEALSAAEEKHETLKTTKGEEREFRRLQVAELKLILVYWGGYLLGTFASALAIHAAYVAYTIGLLVLPALGYQAFKMLHPSSAKYKDEFEEWRFLRRFSLSRENRLGVVHAVVAASLESRPFVSLPQLRRAVKKRLRCDRRRAAEAVDEYLQQEPEVRGRVRGAS